MVKELCIKLYSILIRFHKVRNLKIFESGVSDVMPPNIRKISGLWFSLHYLSLYKVYEVTTFSMIKFYLGVIRSCE